MIDKKKFLESIGFNETDSIQRKRDILFNIKNELIPLLLKELIKDKVYCKKCEEYHSMDDFTPSAETKIITTTTYTDAGYGDDDRVGQVEYIIYYLECPICKEKQEKERTYIRTIKEWTRR